MSGKNTDTRRLQWEIASVIVLKIVLLVLIRQVKNANLREILYKSFSQMRMTCDNMTHYKSHLIVLYIKINIHQR